METLLRETTKETTNDLNTVCFEATIADATERSEFAHFINHDLPRLWHDFQLLKGRGIINYGMSFKSFLARSRK